MLVYHGSNIEINKTDLIHTRKNVDFGREFYTTTIYEQAKNGVCATRVGVKRR